MCRCVGAPGLGGLDYGHNKGGAVKATAAAPTAQTAHQENQMLTWLLLPLASAPNEQPVLCPAEDGRIVGLASDNHHYVRPPADGGSGGSNPERWQAVVEPSLTAGTSYDGPRGSFTGTFYQVLPDDHDSYHDIYGDGSFTMTGLDWAFQVSKSVTSSATERNTLHCCSRVPCSRCETLLLHPQSGAPHPLPALDRRRHSRRRRFSLRCHSQGRH